MVFITDDLAAWLIFILADAGRKKLTSLVLGSESLRGMGLYTAQPLVCLAAAKLTDEARTLITAQGRPGNRW